MILRREDDLTKVPKGELAPHLRPADGRAESTQCAEAARRGSRDARA